MDHRPAELSEAVPGVLGAEPLAGKAIGKGGRNIASIRHIAKRHHEIDEVQVI